MKFIILLIVLVVGGSWGYLHYINIPVNKLEEFSNTLFTVRAKEICSCLYVEKKSLDQCKEMVAYKLPIVKIDVIDRFKLVEAGPMRAHRAYFASDREGCRMLVD